ncbi:MULTISPECIES: hypothetical protein [Mycobacteriaceae]|uniref:hypothetical protein n=1 Tax=Mycobacteriaceae TaxID=1762 RepID=UPI0008001843|nr:MULTISPECIES: hypothetical protein [Mycobacteriaceae]MCK0173382.1 hypothetical protein [Mycolicibacterium sp. F2034L]OBB59474.1 hypothetical protein A5757_13625 [Mycobacterium sp. 852013-51886_SCH5428379]
MTGAHPEIGAELRALAQVILDRLDPAVRFAAARAAAAADTPGACQQVWCPVCALAAGVRGEQHPLLAIVAEHSVALLTVIRAVVDTMDDGSAPPDDTPPPPPPSGPPESSGPGRYQSIPVTVQE